MKTIVIKNTSGIFECIFSFTVAQDVNWFVIEGKTAENGKERLTMDVDFQVMACYRDELGNKYDGYICDENGLLDSTGIIAGNEYLFVEEDSLY